MRPAGLIAHLNVVVTAQQPVIVLAVVHVKQIARAPVTTVVVPPAIQDARINVGEAAPMDALLLVL